MCVRTIHVVLGTKIPTNVCQVMLKAIQRARPRTNANVVVISSLLSMAKLVKFVRILVWGTRVIVLLTPATSVLSKRFRDDVTHTHVLAVVIIFLLILFPEVVKLVPIPVKMIHVFVNKMTLLLSVH